MKKPPERAAGKGVGGMDQEERRRRFEAHRKRLEEKGVTLKEEVEILLRIREQLVRELGEKEITIPVKATHADAG